MCALVQLIHQVDFFMQKRRNEIKPYAIPWDAEVRRVFIVTSRITLK